MNVNEKINTLTEAEAKAALEWCTMNWTRNVSCTNCRIQEKCATSIKEKYCAEIVLEHALQEAQG